MRNISKARNLPVSKVKQFFLSKTSYTKFTLTTQTVNRMRAFARFNKLNFSVRILLLVINWQKKENDVKYSLLCHELFDRTVDAKGMKTKDSKDAVRAFSALITNHKRPEILSFG